MSQVCLFFFVLQLHLETRACNKAQRAVRRERKLSTSRTHTYSSFTQRSEGKTRSKQLLLSSQPTASASSQCYATSLAYFAYCSWEKLLCHTTVVLATLSTTPVILHTLSWTVSQLRSVWRAREHTYVVARDCGDRTALLQLLVGGREQQQNGISFPSIPVAFPLP